MTTHRAATETTSLGRYNVVKRLAAGGMADVLLARTDGIEGFERHVVIKRIHADLLEEERYITMFLDEARLAASLHHHNIVQVNDIGIDGGEYFFAMEYVHGEDARNLLITANERGEKIPLEHVVTIITGAAAGLHHAHEQCGADRSPLHIVHRDVSPANLLVGFDGSVKVADFGIALAAHRKEQTQSGVLKGKVAYMSPEQCNCERVDRRSDVFSLGICLYELATVHPCFAGENDFMTMSAIVAGTVTPPSQLNAAITPELETIILKALATSPAARYQTADEMRVALEHYATLASLRTSTSALGDYMVRQFGTRPLPWHEDEDDLAIGTFDAVDDEDAEPEISMLEEPGGDRAETIDDSLDTPPVATEPRSVKTPQTSPAPRAIEATPVAPAPRAIKATLPLRPAKSREVMPALARPRIDPTIPARPRAMSPSSPDAIEPEHTVVTRVVRARRWWLVGSVIAVFISGLSFVVVSTRGEPPRPAKRVQRVRPHVTPLPAPRMAPSSTANPTIEPAAEPVVEPSADPAREIAPTTTPTVPSKKRRGKKATAAAPPAAVPAPEADTWNPDTLFPK